MTQESVTGGSQKPSSRAKRLSARLSAVQAVYQSSQSQQTLRAVCAEYLQHRSAMEVDGEALVSPDGALLKKILYGVEERRSELEAIVDANIKKDASDRIIEPLLRAILLCGSYELLVKDFDAPIVINDYLNVAHTFYDRGEAALINGVLDSISKLFQ